MQSTFITNCICADEDLGILCCTTVEFSHAFLQIHIIQVKQVTTGIRNGRVKHLHLCVALYLWQLLDSEVTDLIQLGFSISTEIP